MHNSLECAKRGEDCHAGYGSRSAEILDAEAGYHGFVGISVAVRMLAAAKHCPRMH